MKRALPHLRAAACAFAILALGAGARAASARLHAAPAPAAPLSVAAAPAPAVADEVEAASDTQAEPELGAELRLAVTRAALATGDAPGTDSAIVPRPVRSTRLLDAPLDKSGTRVRLYSTEASIEDTRPEMLRGIAARGFTRVATGDEGALDTVSYQRGNDFVVVRFSQRESRTIVSVMELGFRTTGSSSRASSLD